VELAKVTIKVDADLRDVKREFEDAEKQAAKSGRKAADQFNKGLEKAGDVNVGGINGRGGGRGRRGGGGMGAGLGAALGASAGGIAKTAAIAGTAVLGVGAAFAVAGVGLGNFVFDSYKLREVEIQHFKRLKQIRKQMGFTGKAYAGTQKRLINLAGSMEEATGVENELILSAQSTLATFGEVGRTMNEVGGVFDRATLSAVDLAAAGFGSIESNAIALGKALNDPTKGMTALARSGVTFTAQEKEKIKALQASGKMFEAQNILLSAVETQVGGTAEATVTAEQKMSVAWGNFQKQIGQDVTPVMETLFKTITENVVPALGDVWKELSPQVTTWIETFGTWLKTDGEQAIKGFFEWAGTQGVQWATNFASAIAGVAGFIGDMATSIELANEAAGKSEEFIRLKYNEEASTEPGGEKRWYNTMGENIVLGAANTGGVLLSMGKGIGNGLGYALGDKQGKGFDVGRFVDETFLPTGKYLNSAGRELYLKQEAEKQKKDARRRFDLGASTRSSQIPAMAKGGFVTKPTLSLIGEAGPEYVIPERRLNSLIGGGAVTVNVDVHGDGDAQSIKRAVEQALDETMKRGALRLVSTGGY
jgi:hypothetical protein